MTAGTILYYQVKMRTFLHYCDGQQLTQMDQLTPNDLRRFMAYLEETGHNAGGRHSIYAAVKAFLRWYELEAEPDNWKNPIRKVKPPKVPIEPLDAISLVEIGALEATCDRSFLGCRDRAILLALLDTGARAQEFLDVDLADLDLITGAVLIRKGKGRKPRTVYIGSKTKRAVRSYLKFRRDDLPALWVTDNADKRLAYWGLRSMIVRRCRIAKIRVQGLHSFRRQFAISMLRAGIDLATIARLMGHSSLAVLLRYLKQLPGDLQDAHRKAGPVDHADL